MDLDDYQTLSRSTAVYTALGGPASQERIYYTTLGLCGESGEVADKVKKVLRDHQGDFSSMELVNPILLEMGDVLWYLAALATELGTPLSAIAQANLEKLTSRKQRDRLQGSGDAR